MPDPDSKSYHTAAALLRELQQTLPARNRPRLNRIVAALVDSGAQLGATWKSLATLATHHGEIRLARAAMARFVADSGGSGESRFEQARLSAQTGDLRAAQRQLASVPARGPDPAAYAFMMGSTALGLGQHDDARHWLEAAVAAQPLIGSAWLGLAIGAAMTGDPIGDRILAVRGIERAAPSEAAAWWYAAGKVHADRGAVDAAFDSFARGAAIARTLVPFDPAIDCANAADAATFEAATLGKSTGVTSRAMIVTGLPRSGTTLVEQILASHSAVGGGGEINLLRIVAQDVGGVSARAVGQYRARGGSIPALANLYAHLLDERFGPEGRVVDKTLDTSRFLGLAATAMPDMPIVWLRRDPLDCAWSCFRTFFVSGVPWSYDLPGIARHFHLEDALWARWQAVLGDRMLTVPYEELVAAPEAWTRRILTHCGLAEEPAVFVPHKTERAVTTSSVVQVRRPINRDAVGAAEPYRRHLRPFLDAYSAI